MGLLFRLSLRNLFRQKRRNLLLGTGIAFGMTILVIANSFSHGMVDVLIHDIVANTFGHIVINSNNGGYFPRIPDKERIIRIIHQNVPKDDLLSLSEYLRAVGQAVGNDAADNVILVGVTTKNKAERQAFFKDYFTLVEGNFDDYFRNDIEYPVIISQAEAKSLKVKLHDAIRVRLPMVTGQINTAKMNVIAIANTNNTLMDLVLFMDGDRLKKLLGYQPWESANLRLILRNPQMNANKYADILWQKLQPQPFVISGRINGQACRMLPFNNDDRSKAVLSKAIQIIQGNLKDGLAKDGLMLSGQLAAKLHATVGSELHYQYRAKFTGLHEEILTVKAIYNSHGKLSADIVLVNGEKIYDIYGRFLPAQIDQGYIADNDPLYPALATEWKRLPRTHDSDSLQKLNRAESQIRSHQMKMNVITMYEGASEILKLEGVLNSITLVAVLVLFFIILIGVVNTLRMTIRERTREIGTTRAIGMQKKDVRNEFILETVLLVFFSCLVGIGAGILVMQILSLIPLEWNSALNIILKNKHLYFKLDPVAILKQWLLILAITGVTAYFPARRAANLSAAEALRHYE